jgi:hypothetical protein
MLTENEVKSVLQVSAADSGSRQALRGGQMGGDV